MAKETKAVSLRGRFGFIVILMLYISSLLFLQSHPHLSPCL